MILTIDGAGESAYRRKGAGLEWSTVAGEVVGNTSPAFVGRHHELSLLEEAWSSVAGGARQAVFVGGEPGAGKSRLIVEVCTVLGGLGAAVLIGNCVAELGPPYQPFEDPVEVLREGVVTGSLAPGESARWSALAVSERLGTIAGLKPAHEDQPGLDERREMYDALVLAVRAAADQRPLVMVLEDLQWAGSTSLQVLSYLVERTPDARLLVLGTHRTTAPDRSHDLVQKIAALYRLDGVRRVDLAPLDTEDIAEFLIQEGGVPRHRAGPAAVVLRDRTGGNPFFLREIWLDVVGHGALSSLRVGDEPAPEIIRDTVLHRIRSLSTAHRDVLGVAAVIGEEVDAPTLLATVGSDDALAALDEVVATGLLEPVPGADGLYRFLHALARQAVLDLMPSSQRARQHERVAAILEQRGGPVQVLAHHYAAAHLLGHADKAVRYLTEAARVADRSLAHAEAAALLERAAGLCADSYARDEHRLSAARSYHLACDFGRARELFLLVATRGDPRHRLRAATAYEDAAWFTARSGRQALDLIEAALHGVTPNPTDPGYVRALGGLGRATAQTGAHTEAETLVARAIEMARATGSDELIGDTLAASMQVDFRPSSRMVKLPRALELSDVAQRTGQWLHLGPAAYHRSVMAYQDGDRAALAAARRDLERTAEAAGQRHALRVGLPRAGGLIRRCRGGRGSAGGPGRDGAEDPRPVPGVVSQRRPVQRGGQLRCCPR